MIGSSTIPFACSPFSFCFALVISCRGGWILFKYPGVFSFNDFLISNFALLFSLFGLGAAFQDLSDRKEAEKSAGRIFYLLDRQSEIDPLSEDGVKLDGAFYKPTESVASA